MKAQTIKSATQIKLQGVAAEVRFVNGNVRQVTLTDAGGFVLTIEEGKYGGLDVSVPAPPKTVKKFKLLGRIENLPVDELFPDKQRAESRRSHLESVDPSSTLEVLEVEVLEVEVPETDETADAEIPF